MKDKSILLLIILLLITLTPLHAQFSIHGKVLAENGKALEKASISLLQLPDSTLFMQTSSNESGQYDFTANTHGNFILRISSVGYETYYSKAYSTKHGDKLTITPAILNPQAIALNAVHIFGKPPVVQQFVDKMVVHVEESALAEGNNVLELLEKTPGIVSDGKGNFSIQGRTGANIKINGRDVYVSGAQLASMLRGLQARDIAKLELVSTPSSKEDASGSAGIINIITKKNKHAGWGGDVFLRGSHTRKAQASAGAGLHYKTERLNVFTNLSTGHEEGKESSDLVRTWSNPDGSLQRKQIQHEERRLNPGRYHSILTGLTFDIDSSSTLEASFSWIKGNYISYSDIQLDFSDASQQVTQSALTNNRFDEGYNNLTFNVNYNKKYEQENHYLKVNLDFAPHSNAYDNDFYTRYQQANTLKEPSARHNLQDLSNTTYSARVDYSQPIGRHSLYELGWKGTHFFIDNQLRNDTLQQGAWVRDNNSSYDFQYTQHVEAAYATFGSKINSFEYKLGLRAEYTYTKANQQSIQQADKNNYLHLFPTLFTSYAINEKHNLRAAYSSRIARPSDHDVNVFRVYEDPFSYYEGNPDLKPEISNILELGHGFKNKLFTTLGLSHSKDVITWITGIGENPSQTYSRPENLGKHLNYSASMMYNNRFASFWDGSHYINAFHNSFKGTVGAIDLDRKGSSWTANSRHTFNFQKGWRIEALGYYNSPLTDGIRQVEKTYGLDLAVEKKLLSERAMIKLAANGLVRNGTPQYSSSFANLQIDNKRFPDNRKVLLSLQYRFGS